MTESEWITSECPAAMLRFLRMGPGGAAGLLDCPVSDRKLHLFACACCRQIWHLLTDSKSRDAVEVAERFADGEATEEELEAVYDDAIECSHVDADQIGAMRMAYVCCSPEIARQASNPFLGYCDSLVESSLLAILLREIVGNPWRPMCPLQAMNLGRGCGWITPTVVSLVQAAYEERQDRQCPNCRGRGKVPSGVYEMPAEKCDACHGSGRIEDGTLDNMRLLVLADALEEAGCNNEDVLCHLRSPKPHVRGCWVLDLVLGKS